MFGLRSKSADGFLGSAPAPETQSRPATESFNEATARLAREHTQRQLEQSAQNAALGVDAFNRLRDVEKFGVKLALLFDGHDPALASGIRALVAESIKTGLVCPRCKWWAELGVPGF